eukprot:TRINITY_DN114682_c0_g1_i1.p1 TRINITY_DN114682_c0_g1~~TRINITY_DN114682_c0_g1_i1.p1  ORF type:complete len:195 (+),score=14.65 TRINITY_DN114682_c0_g1_i1:123-707(+)
MERPGTRLENQKTKMCRFFRRNRCSAGDDCSFAHTFEELREGKAPDICRHWKRGYCLYGNICKRLHEGDDPTSPGSESIGGFSMASTEASPATRLEIPCLATSGFGSDSAAPSKLALPSLALAGERFDDYKSLYDTPKQEADTDGSYTGAGLAITTREGDGTVSVVHVPSFTEEDLMSSPAAEAGDPVFLEYVS